MSLLGRLFGSKTPPPPPPNSVIVAPDLAAQLTAAGAALDEAVDHALRSYFEAQAKLSQPTELEGMPFWLRRDAERSGDIEDELRDKVIQRQSAEEAETGGSRRTPGKQMELGGG